MSDDRTNWLRPASSPQSEGKEVRSLISWEKSAMLSWWKSLMQFWNRIPRITTSKFCMLSLTEYAWEIRNNGLRDRTKTLLKIKMYQGVITPWMYRLIAKNGICWYGSKPLWCAWLMTAIFMIETFQTIILVNAFIEYLMFECARVPQLCYNSKLTSCCFETGSIKSGFYQENGLLRLWTHNGS